MSPETQRRTSRQLLWLYLTTTSLKLLLIPSYKSTDFEVHRNWLATTHTLPISQWYSDQTSQWTLDYPPFFAFFELFLSFFANLIDPKIVNLHHGLNYSENSVIVFQRVTVVLSDLVLFYSVWRLKTGSLIWVLVLLSPMLVVVDHLHFQYNGFLLGLLLLSVGFLKDGRDFLGGFWFAVLLCFKHLFAVAAPVYFVYLLRRCFGNGGVLKGFGRVLVLGSIVVAVFAAAFGPFAYHGQIQQVLRRMFPFGRGLCHAYWAPNFWVFYIMLDKGLSFLLRKAGFDIQAPAASFTGGIVGDSSPFAVLPQITPMTTFLMVLLALSPSLIKAWRNPQPKMIARWIGYAYICGFLFGWHVHEKASLHFVIPLAIVAVESVEDAKHYYILAIVSCYSLFPLLFEPQEYPIKVLLLLLHSILMWLGFSAQFNAIPATTKKKGNERRLKGSGVDPSNDKGEFHICWTGKLYLLGLLFVELWSQFLHPSLLGNKLPFVPLMLISVYCALGIMYSWIWQLGWILESP